MPLPVIAAAGAAGARVAITGARAVTTGAGRAARAPARAGRRALGTRAARFAGRRLARRVRDEDAEERPVPREQIPIPTMLLMLSASVLVDTIQMLMGILQLMPFAGIVFWLFTSLINTGAYIGFYIWLQIKKEEPGPLLLHPSRGGWFFGGMLLESLPIAGILPWWSISIWRIIRSLQKSDKEYNRTRLREWEERVAARANDDTPAPPRLARTPYADQQEPVTAPAARQPLGDPLLAAASEAPARARATGAEPVENGAMPELAQEKAIPGPVAQETPEEGGRVGRRQPTAQPVAQQAAHSETPGFSATATPSRGAGAALLQSQLAPSPANDNFASGTTDNAPRAGAAPQTHNVPAASSARARAILAGTSAEGAKKAT